MKKTVVLTALLVFSISVFAQKLNKVVYSNETKQKILIGEINKKGLKKRYFKKWFTEEYNNYTPDNQAIEQLKGNYPENAKIVIVMATWCPDSRREVPRFLKILDETGFNYENLKIYAVDRNFKAGDIDISKYNIKKVPTIIYYQFGYEAGRIVETPETSLEKDLLTFRKRK